MCLSEEKLQMLHRVTQCMMYMFQLMPKSTCLWLSCKWDQLYFPLLCLSSEHGRGYEVGVGNTDGNVASSLSASSESKLEYNHVLNSVTCL